MAGRNTLLWGTAADRIVRCVQPDLREQWPSRFGDHDHLGMLNHISYAARAAALLLARQGAPLRP